MKSARGVLSLCLARCASPGTVRPHALVRGINQFGSIFLRRCRAGFGEGIGSQPPLRRACWRPGWCTGLFLLSVIAAGLDRGNATDRGG
jgi:hypothetical protein